MYRLSASTTTSALLDSKEPPGVHHASTALDLLSRIVSGPGEPKCSDTLQHSVAVAQLVRFCWLEVLAITTLEFCSALEQ